MLGRFILPISAVSNVIETIDNEMICFIIFCLNCIRHGRNATYEPGFSVEIILSMLREAAVSYISPPLTAPPPPPPHPPGYRLIQL